MKNNMSKYYLTPTLLNSWLGGYDSFYDLLYRKETEPNENMLKGIEFENLVVSGEYEELNKIVDGALYQQFVCRELNGFMLLGYCDLIKKDTIYDIKYVKSYDIGKYNSSVQHLIYLFCTDMNKFEYIIGCGKNIYFEAQPRNDKRLLEIIKNFDNWLEITNLKEVYQENFKTERKQKEIEEFLFII